MTDNQNTYLPYFSPEEGKGIRDIFSLWHTDEMLKVRVSVRGKVETQQLNLADYTSVCQFNKLIKRCIEGYGFNPDESYDHLSGDERTEFRELTANVGTNMNPNDINPEKYRKYFDVGRIIDRNHRMPQINRKKWLGRPLSHEAITAFNAWLKNGMREKEGSEPYTGEQFRK